MYLARGDTFKTIGNSYRIVIPTFETICKTLLALVIPVPTKEMWEESEKQFDTIWNFPSCIGGLDAKHVVIQAQKKLRHYISTTKEIFLLFYWLWLVQTTSSFLWIQAVLEKIVMGEFSHGRLWEKAYKTIH